MARLTGLEPATPGVTGRYSNHLSYNRPLRLVVLGTLPRRVKRRNDVHPQLFHSTADFFGPARF